MTKKRISIIVPVYNVNLYLRACLDSILSQTFGDFELILIDDGSTDGSSLICDEYGERDERVKVIHQENAGVSAARNRGIDEAEGEYISFIDSDDWIEDNMYELLYHCAKDNASDYVYCNFFHEKGNTSTLHKTAKCEEDDYTKTISNHLEMWCVAVWNSLIRNEIVQHNHIRFNTQLAYNEDYNFMAKCFSYFHKISKVEKGLYHYNEDNETSALHKRNSPKSEHEYTSQIDVMDYYTKNGLFMTYRVPFCHRIIRCLFFLKGRKRDKRYDSYITAKDIISCPHLGIRGKTYVALKFYRDRLFSLFSL